MSERPDLNKELDGKSNLSIIHTSEISSKIIREEVWMKLLHVGNIKRVCKDTIVMKSLTLLR